MNRNILNFSLTILLAFVFSMFLPWWAIMLASFISSLLISLEKIMVFLIPFFAVFIYWAVYCYLLSSSNDFILARKISELVNIGGSPYLLIILSAAIGGISSGASALFANQIKINIKWKFISFKLNYTNILYFKYFF